MIIYYLSIYIHSYHHQVQYIHLYRFVALLSINIHKVLQLGYNRCVNIYDILLSVPLDCQGILLLNLIQFYSQIAIENNENVGDLSNK